MTTFRPGEFFCCHNAIAERVKEVGAVAAAVYLVLAEMADPAGKAFPSITTLRKTCGVSERWAREAIHRLEEAGLIHVEHAKGKVSVYIVNTNPPFIPRNPEHGVERIPPSHSTGPSGTPVPDPPEPRAVRTIPTNKTHLTKRRALRFDPTDLDTASWMFAKILELDSTAKKPNLESWANDLRLIRERDVRTDTDIRALFGWANGHHFWGGNILCPAKLREQWGKLTIQRNGAGGNGRPRTPDRLRLLTPED